MAKLESLATAILDISDALESLQSEAKIHVLEFALGAIRKSTPAPEPKPAPKKSTIKPLLSDPFDRLATKLVAEGYPYKDALDAVTKEIQLDSFRSDSDILEQARIELGPRTVKPGEHRVIPAHGNSVKETVAYIEEMGSATVRDVMGRFGVSYSGAGVRVRSAKKAGLIEPHPEKKWHFQVKKNSCSESQSQKPS